MGHHYYISNATVLLGWFKFRKKVALPLETYQLPDKCMWNF
jgi:hypothetical protein